MTTKKTTTKKNSSKKEGQTIEQSSRYSIENTETPDTLLAAKNFNITNIHQRVIWIRPEDKESIYKLCVFFKFEIQF